MHPESHRVAVAWLVIVSAALGVVAWKSERVRTVIMFACLSLAALSMLVGSLWAITDILR